MFIGEAPGTEEDQAGRPFVGAAGRLLDRMIAAMQFRRDEVYIANVVKCRPPRNRVPTAGEGEACMPYLARQIELVRPEVIVLLGATPLQHVLGLQGVTRLRGTWQDYKGIPVMPTFHPAFLLRYEPRKKEVWADLQDVMRRLGKATRNTAQASAPKSSPSETE
jgi:DNA polymerase